MTDGSGVVSFRSRTVAVLVSGFISSCSYSCSGRTNWDNIHSLSFSSFIPFGMAGGWLGRRSSRCIIWQFLVSCMALFLFAAMFGGFVTADV